MAVKNFVTVVHVIEAVNYNTFSKPLRLLVNIIIIMCVREWRYGACVLCMSSFFFFFLCALWCSIQVIVHGKSNCS